MTGRISRLTALAFLSGCCALAYEVLYIRALTTLLGDMLYVHAALLSTFLVGIGLGAKLAHRWHRWLWAFEVATGLYALWLPVAARWFADRPLMSEISGSPGLTIAVTVGLLCLPSLWIGFSIPLFSAYIKAAAGERLAFQGVYMAYNLGALTSILAVELLLVRAVGVSWSLALIGGVNLFNGLLLLVMRDAPASLPEERRREFPRRIVLALALASLASAAFQMIFLKLTYLVFGPHRENFAVALSISLLGIFLGASIAARVRLRFESFMVLVPIWIGAAFLAFVPILHLHRALSPWAQASELANLLAKFGIGGLYALGPMILFGATLPALMRTECEVAGESGHLLWVSSLANAAGYLLYVVVGHPWLSTPMLLAAIAAAALAASLLAAGYRWSAPQWSAALVGVALVAGIGFRWQERDFYLAQWVEELQPADEVTVFKSGAESATLLRTDAYEWVSYNGHPSIYVQYRGVVTISETMSGIIPALGAPRLERALVLGLGTGITGGATSRIFDETDVVEINNAFYKMMPRLAHANQDIANNPRAIRHLSDGRAFLIGREGVYDAIVNSIPAPTYYSASKIYTVEFYERVVRALRPDGVFCTWLSWANMSQGGVETVLSALRKNFEYCDLRLIYGSYYMATCSNEPVRPRAFDELPVPPELEQQLARGLSRFDLTRVFEATRVSDNLFEHYTPRVEHENTDDHPVLEFMVVRNYQLGRMGEDPFLIEQERMNIDPVQGGEREGPDALAERAATFYALGSYLFQHNFEPLLRDDPAALRSWREWGYSALAAPASED